nr:TonB-dependent receptor plug domain-containing protein [Prevotella sp.]
MKERKAKRLLLLVWMALVSLTVSAQSSSKRVTLDMQNVTVKDFFAEVKKQTGLNFMYDANEARQWPKVSIKVVGKQASEAIDQVVTSIGCKYSISGNIVTVSKQQLSGRERTIKGYVRDAEGQALMGVPVCIGESRVCTVTDANGYFVFKIPTERTSLKFSYVGMDTYYVTIPGGQVDVRHDVTMKSATSLSDVVVTGIFTRKKESFTGSAATYDQKELKAMGTSNVLQSLKTLDPAFAVIDDTQFGSDPNRLPNMEIRGKSSVLGQRDALQADPNQPLFILDGFESSLQAINDLDINRIESITILKDAASTAIYGSKAANGVVVVETVKPKAGQLQVSYTGNFNMSIPDLTSYDMMDASEKIEFERLSGRYDPSIVETPNQTQTAISLSENYYARLNSIAEGVNTDWVAQPVRVGTNHKHSLYVQGGSDSFMFG